MGVTGARRGWVVAVSVAAHVLPLALLLRVHGPRLLATAHPGTAAGSRITLNYSPGRSAPQTAGVAPHAVAASKAPAAVKAVKVLSQLSSAASVVATAAGATSGSDSKGSGNVTVALATFFPWPRPDLSELAHGARGDVIVEVTIDATGRITESKLAQGLGPNIDQNVLTMIQSWVFKPATKDGVAVSSEQELLFHYERG